jgi:arginase
VTWDLLVSPWHLDERIDGFPVPAGAVTFTGTMTRRYRDIADAVARSERPLVLTGDCLTTLGVVAGLRRHDLSVIWLDAHGDFNTPAISESGYLAGMSLAMVTGRAPGPIELRPVPDERAVLVGARDLDPAERAALDASRVRRVAADPEAVRDAMRQASGEIYVHIDVDVIDGEDLPGLKFPAGDGPSFSLVEECLAQIADPIAATIACAWTPDRIADESTRRAIARLAAAIGAELEWPA